MVASSLGERREQKFGDLYNFYENTNFNKFLGSKHQKSRSMALSSKLCFLFIRILARLFTLCTVVTEPFWLFLTQHAGLFRKVCALCFGNIFRGPLRRRSTTRPLVSTFISFFAISGLCRCRRLEQQLQLLPPRPPPVRKESKTRSDFLLCSLKLVTTAERGWVGERGRTARRRRKPDCCERSLTVRSESSGRNRASALSGAAGGRNSAAARNCVRVRASPRISRV